MEYLVGADGLISFLEVRHIVKNFGGVRALDGVDLAVWPGEVLCLAGENGWADAC